MDETNLIKLMIVGCGVRGRSWTRAIKENPDCEISAFVDINQDNVNRIKDMYGDESVTEYIDFDKALEEADVDGVILATPPQFHYDQSMAILDRNIHLLCEKPLTEDYETSLEIVRHAEEKGLILIVGMQFRYMPITQGYRKLVRDREFGSPNYAQFSYIRTRNPMNYRGMVLNQYCNDMAHTFLLEQAIHHLDLIRYVYDSDFEWVQVYEWNPTEWKHNPYKQDPNVSALLMLKNGVHVNYMGTWISGNVGMDTGIDFRWRTDCSEGVIVQPHLFGEGGLYVASYEDEKLTHIDTGLVIPFATDTDRLLVEFYESWMKNEKPDTSGKDHMKTLTTILACIESSEKGRRINVDEFRRSLSYPEEWME
jgi:predicted dehydrogenase